MKKDRNDMKNEITLNQYELEKILIMLNNFNNEDGQGEVSKRFRTVSLIQEGDNGIGTTLDAQFSITHHGVDGEFMVRITDVEDW
jgi:hypothetical protein